MGGRAYLVVDVASLRHAIGDVRQVPGGYGDLYLDRLVRVLRGRRYELTGIALAVGTEIRVPHGHPDRARARDWVEGVRAWVERERRTCPVEFEVLPGGTDGRSEVGVDDLVVARSLLEAKRIERDPARAGEKILVISHDVDMSHLAEFAQPTHVRLVMYGNAQVVRYLVRERIEHETLTREEVESCGLAYSTAPVPDAAVLDGRRRLETPPLPPLAPSGVMVTVDAYGLACTAASALGVSRLPSVRSVRECLAQLGPTDARVVHFALPDICLKEQPRDRRSRLTAADRKAWRTRDEDLDRLEQMLTRDEDPGTQVHRGYLAPARIRPEERLDPSRQAPLRAAKRHSTLLTAMVMRQWLTGVAPDVVIMTDDADVIWALDHVVRRHGAESRSRLRRIGTVACPVCAYDSPDGTTACLPYLLLTEGRLAALVNVSSYTGRVLRDALAHDYGDSGLLAQEWKVMGYEPEVRGFRARSMVDPRVEIVIMDAQRLGVDQDQILDGSALQLELHIDRERPVTAPTAVPGDSRLGGRPDWSLVAEVTGRTSSAISFDLDNDGRADVELSVGLDYRPVRPGATAILGRLVADARHLVYVAAPYARQRGEQRARVVRVDPQSTWIVTRDTSEPMPLDPVGGAPLPPLREGDGVWVVDVGVEGSPTFVALSSALDDGPLGHPAALPVASQQQ
jgi:hypothetical protein